MSGGAGRRLDGDAFGLGQEELGLLAVVGRLAEERLPVLAGRFLAHALLEIEPKPDLAGLTPADSSAANSAAILRRVQATRGVESMLGGQLSLLLEQDVPGKIAKVDHVIWKKRLADMLVGLETLRPEELASHEAAGWASGITASRRCPTAPTPPTSAVGF